MSFFYLSCGCCHKWPVGTVELSYLDVFKNIAIEIQIDAAEAEELTRSYLGVSSNLLFSMILANLFSCCPKLAV